MSIHCTALDRLTPTPPRRKLQPLGVDHRLATDTNLQTISAGANIFSAVWNRLTFCQYNHHVQCLRTCAMFADFDSAWPRLLKSALRPLRRPFDAWICYPLGLGSTRSSTDCSERTNSSLSNCSVKQLFPATHHRVISATTLPSVYVGR